MVALVVERGCPAGHNARFHCLTSELAAWLKRPEGAMPDTVANRDPREDGTPKAAVPPQLPPPYAAAVGGHWPTEEQRRRVMEARGPGGRLG